MRCAFKLLLFALAWAALGSLLSAQSAPTFEVASIRRNTAGTTQQSVNVQPTGVTFINFQLRAIMQLAWGISQPARLVGLPDWVNDRYDVIAKTGTPVSPATIVGMRPALQALFADRMKMVAAIEQREMPAYALVMARSDGRLGPALKPSTVVCAGRGAAPNAAAASPGGQEPVPCGPRTGGPGRFVFVGSEMSLFAGVLSLQQRRTVVDRTGLKGLYDFEVTYAPETPGGAPSDGPSLFTALQEQLGIKLDPEREIVDVLVVKAIERPTEN